MFWVAADAGAVRVRTFNSAESSAVKQAAVQGGCLVCREARHRRRPLPCPCRLTSPCLISCLRSSIAGDHRTCVRAGGPELWEHPRYCQHRHEKQDGSRRVRLKQHGGHERGSANNSETGHRELAGLGVTGGIRNKPGDYGLAAVIQQKWRLAGRHPDRVNRIVLVAGLGRDLAAHQGPQRTAIDTARVLPDATVIRLRRDPRGRRTGERCGH
jgi:hypothetical protein